MISKIADTFHSLSLGDLLKLPIPPFRVAGFGTDADQSEYHPDTEQLQDILDSAPRKEIFSIDSSAACLEAAKEMLDLRVSSLMVKETGNTDRIVTDQDFFVHRMLVPDRLISQISVKPDTYDARMPIAFALGAMLYYGYRHIPVTFGKEELAERMLSSRDILKYYREVFRDEPIFKESIGSILHNDKHTNFADFHVSPKVTLDQVSLKAYVLKAGGLLVSEDDGTVPLGVFNGIDNLKTLVNRVPGDAPVGDFVGLKDKSLLIRSSKTPLSDIVDDILEFGTRHVVVRLHNRQHVLVGMKRILGAIVSEKPADIHNLPESKKTFMQWAESACILPDEE